MRLRPAITCLCVTHGRPYLLAEAVESFRRQECTHLDHEMLIVNDCPEQTLVCDVPGVKIYNTRDMFRDLSAKFNAAVALVETEWIAWWEDDDISLPGRLYWSLWAAHRMGVDAYKQGRAWFWEHGQIRNRPANLFFGSALFRRSAWRGATNGHPADKSAWERMTDVVPAVDDYPPADRTYFVYRWGGTGHHDSAVNGTNEDRFNSFRFAVTRDPRFRRGEILVDPVWHHDYESQEKAAIRAEERRGA